MVGSQATASVTLVDNDLLTVSVTASDASASEAGPDNGVFTISRTGSLASALTIDYAITGTATNGTDYVQLVETAGVGSVTIPAGQSSATVTITPLTDSVNDGSETVVWSLIAPAGYSVESQASQATVTIADNPVIPPPITFSISVAIHFSHLRLRILDFDR